MVIANGTEDIDVGFITIFILKIAPILQNYLGRL
jgi:hypothetical protein